MRPEAKRLAGLLKFTIVVLQKGDAVPFAGQYEIGVAVAIGVARLHTSDQAQPGEWLWCKFAAVVKEQKRRSGSGVLAKRRASADEQVGVAVALHIERCRTAGHAVESQALGQAELTVFNRINSRRLGKVQQHLRLAVGERNQAGAAGGQRIGRSLEVPRAVIEQNGQLRIVCICHQQVGISVAVHISRSQRRAVMV